MWYCCVISCLISLIGSILSFGEAYSQHLQQQYEINSLNDSLLQLPNAFIDQSTITLQLDSTIVLTQPQDYSIVDTTERSYIVLSKSIRSLLYSNTLQGTIPNSHHTIKLEYDLFPTTLSRTYSFFHSDTDSNRKETNVRFTNSDTNRSSNVQPSSDLQFTKAGGISRGLQVGSSQDATFTNSFNLTFSGTLGDDFAFKGALSEESTPLQPEGNTQTLRDIDRIYIELRAKKYFAATIGDYALTLQHIRLDSVFIPTIYDNISRKVLGASTIFQLGPTALLTSYSVTKGQFNSLSLQGIDGVQGPYRLTGKNGEQAIIVIAGTEHIYIDGTLLTRGEQNDYTIDYGLAEIRFTVKRIITSASRITVDYEYTDEQYSHNFLAVKQASSFFDNDLSFTTTYLREGDDQNNPRDLSLSDSDKNILAQAGNDPSKATKNGVSFAGKDANGKARGYYIAIDTISNLAPIHFYRYQPFDTLNAVYTIAFGFAGTNKGQYIRKSIGEYAYVGFGNGDYDTLIYLPLPQLHQSLSAKLQAKPFAGLTLSAEGAASELQANRFSSSQATDGKAYTISAAYNDSLFKITNDYLRLHLIALRKFTSSDFSPFDRIRTVESIRQYGLESNSFGTTALLQTEQENAIASQVEFDRISIGYTFGDYQLGTSFYKAQHYQYSLGLDGSNTSIPDVSARYDLTTTTDSSSNSTSNWHLVTLNAHKLFTSILINYTPSFTFNYGDRTGHSLSVISDSLLLQSFRYFELIPSVTLNVNRSLSMTTSYQYRSDDSSRSGLFIPISRSSQFQVATTLRLDNGFSGSFDFGFHKRTFIDSVSKRYAGGDNTSLLMHFTPRYHNANNSITVEADYQASELRSATLQRLFFAVQPGQGNYTYLGDLNGNKKQDPEEFQPSRYSDQGTYILLTIPTDQLTPTVNLRTSFRLRVDPAVLGDSNIFHFFSPLSFETVVRFEDNSTDPTTSNIYLLKLSHFLNDSLTLSGSKEYQQDINLFEHNAFQSYRLRWFERTSAAQYNTGLERSYRREVTLRAKINPLSELSTEQTLSYSQQIISSSEQSTNRPQNTKQYKFQSILSFIPFASPISFGCSFSVGSISDPIYLLAQNALTDAISFSSRYSVTNQLSLKAEIGRNEFVAHTKDNAFLPYGLSDGFQPGLTWQWSLGADQEITRGVLLNVKYEGRSEPQSFSSDRHITHTGRAEIRASF